MKNLLLTLLLAVQCTAGVTSIRVPNGGIQPQLVERDGVIHLLYFSGDPANGSLFYTRSADYGQTFSKPLPVNDADSGAMAVGNIRGAQLAVGKGGRVHVAWNGVAPVGALPMYYTRLNDAGRAFEKPRNVIGFELKESYWKQAIENTELAKAQAVAVEQEIHPLFAAETP